MDKTIYGMAGGLQRIVDEDFVAWDWDKDGKLLIFTAETGWKKVTTKGLKDID